MNQMTHTIYNTNAVTMMLGNVTRETKGDQSKVLDSKMLERTLDAHKQMKVHQITIAKMSFKINETRRV